MSTPSPWWAPDVHADRRPFETRVIAAATRRFFETRGLR
jgi:elongation factor P--beta-lysine ligase